MTIEPDFEGAEQDLLLQYLDVQRDVMLRKTDGLSREQLGRAMVPSALTLAGLLNHLALVEDNWMQERFLGQAPRPPWSGVDWDADPDWDFRTAVDLEPPEVRQRYTDACARTRAVVDEAASLDQLSVSEVDGRLFSLRWVLLHLIEETARHAGHADLLREAVDGSVGE